MLASVTRTFVPLIVAYLIRFIPGVDPEALTELVTLVVGAGYYTVIRAAERYLHPEIGWLLGYAREPVYHG